MKALRLYCHVVLFVSHYFTKWNWQTWSNFPLATFGSERVKVFSAMAYIPWKPLLRIEERHSTEWITGGNGHAPFDTNESLPTSSAWPGRSSNIFFVFMSHTYNNKTVNQFNWRTRVTLKGINGEQSVAFLRNLQGGWADLNHWLLKDKTKSLLLVLTFENRAKSQYL